VNVNTELNIYRNMHKKNPNAFNDFLLDNPQIIARGEGATSFVSYYIANIAILSEGLDESVITKEEIQKRSKEIENITDTAEKKRALELLFNAISKNDANYIDDAIGYLKEALFVNFDK